MMRIMLLADAPWANTGYSKMAGNLIRFCKLAELGHAWAWTCIGGLSGGKLDWGDNVQLYPRGNDIASQDVIMDNYMEFNADLLITWKDVWLFGSLPSMPANWAPTVPLDHQPISTHITHKLQTAFAPIAISRVGQIELTRHKIHSTYIPHAVDMNLYRPVDEVPKPELKKRLGIPPDSWVVGMVAMNRSRKCIARQMRGFKRFLEDNPDAEDAIMFLWTNVLPEGDPAAVDLRPIIKQLELNEKVYYPSQAMYEKGLPEVKMPHLYNCFDVLSNVSSEGAGLPILEAGACGVPQLVLRYAAGPEYWTSGGIVKCADIEFWATPGVPFGLMGIDDYAEKLGNIYNGNPEKYKRRALRGVKPFAWPTVVERFWKPFFEDLETRTRPLITKEGVSSWRTDPLG